MLLSLFCECPEKQRDGTPVYVASPNGDITFYIRRWGTKESEAIVKDLRRSLFGPIHRHSDDDISEIYAHWLVEYGVAKWEGLTNDETAKPVEYSKDNARSLFLDKRYWLSLNQKLINDALNFEQYLIDEVEEATDAIKKP